MNVKKFPLVGLFLLTVFILTGGVLTLVSAQSPSPGSETTAPMESAVISAAAVTPAMSYQGVLKEGGLPVTGAREMTFTLYSDQTCSTQVSTHTTTVTVSQGLFHTALNLDPADFNGQALWLETVVGGVKLSCQEILPVPYALSLRPGAAIEGSSVDPILSLVNDSTGQAFYVRSSGGAGLSATGSTDGVYGGGGDNGVRGYSNKVGVYGDSYAGTGVKGRSSIGVGGYFSSYNDNIIEAWTTGSDPANRRFYINNDGNVRADGSFTGGGADFAEMLPATAGLEPGDVLVIGPMGQLQRSDSPFAATVMGVYSTHPGFVGGSDEELENPGKIPLAVLGVVPVKASAENGPILPGSLLVTAATPGHAMLAGADPAAGAVIGKALEPLDEGAGVIQMMVMLQ